MSLTTRDTATLLDLKRRMDRLSAGDKLRLCAALLDKGGDTNCALVETLAAHVVDGLRAARLLRARP